MHGLVLAASDGSFSDAISFIFHQRESVAGGVKVGGSQLLPLLGRHVLVTLWSILAACAISVPLAVLLAHSRRGAFIAASASNVGRAVPALTVLLFFSAYLGLGKTNLVFAMTLLAIPPIFTNTFVGVLQVDADVVDAARGMGLGALQVVTRVELPMSLPLIFGGIRTSAVNVIATATLGPYVGVVTLGDPIVNASVYGSSGRLAGAIMVAALALVAELLFAAIQRAVTPAGLRADPARARLLRRRPLAAASA